LLYQFCDSEIFFQNTDVIFDKIKNLCNIYNQKIIVVFSTKSKKILDKINFIETLNTYLNKNGSFLKIGVSFTNISFPELEEGTSSFEERIDLLKKLCEYGFKLSTIIKPVLPFISDKEYINIVDTANQYTDKFLIGGLYVDVSSSFYDKYNLSNYNPILRTVHWMNDNKCYYIGSDQKQQNIKNHIISLGKEVYDSDLEMIESWITKCLMN
jgi:DNA repair photolyase